MVAYSAKAQPYLDAIAAGVFSSEAVRAWILKGTEKESSYAAAAVLIQEQQAARWRKKETKQPFWSNYFCGLDAKCTCRIEGSRSLESDAIFFLKNSAGRVLALHVEFKHPHEPFQRGQAEGYPLRAACFARTHTLRPQLIAHDDWATIIFCDDSAAIDPGCKSFDRVIPHSEARQMLPTYPL